MTVLETTRAAGVQLADTALALAEQYGQQLTPLDVLNSGHLPYGNRPQSLAHGAAGIALLHIERAARGIGSWQIARQWLGAAASGEISCGANAGAYYGAPALAFVLRVAVEASPGSFSRALGSLDQATDEVVRRRIDATRHRKERGELPHLAEFDTLRGLTGLGMVLVHRETEHELLSEVLTCLVELARPAIDGDERLPGLVD